MKPHIVTYTGKTVNPLALRPKDIVLEDIAHALASCNRFAGHTAMPISVAQHSVMVSWEVEGRAVHMRKLSPETRHALAVQALFHDASEAYLGDVCKWVKRSEAMAAYREAEAVAMKAVFDRFDCPPIMHSLVEQVDHEMCCLEIRIGFGKHMQDKWPSVGHRRLSAAMKRAYKRWTPWDEDTAEHEFLARYAQLTGNPYGDGDDL